MPQVWFTGCTHFKHGNIIGLCNRPFKDIHEHDEELIFRWNSTVKPNDTVHHVGDFGMADSLVTILPRLNGNIFFVQGNHDPAGFGAPYRELKTHGTLVVLSHYPFEEWNKWYRGSLHVHAHTHCFERVTAPGRYSVGVDANDFAPVSLDELIETHRIHKQKPGGKN